MPSALGRTLLEQNCHNAELRVGGSRFPLFLPRLIRPHESMVHALWPVPRVRGSFPEVLLLPGVSRPRLAEEHCHFHYFSGQNKAQGQFRVHRLRPGPTCWGWATTVGSHLCPRGGHCQIPPARRKELLLPGRGLMGVWEPKIQVDLSAVPTPGPRAGSTLGQCTCHLLCIPASFMILSGIPFNTGGCASFLLLCSRLPQT